LLPELRKRSRSSIDRLYTASLSIVMPRGIVLSVAVLVLLAGSIPFVAQTRTAQTSPSPRDLQQHYVAAQNAQSAGDLDRATREYRIFLANALRLLADHGAGAGDFAKAVDFLPPVNRQEALLNFGGLEEKVKGS
jgi:hypothetical protein